MSKTNVTIESPVALDDGQLERVGAVLKKITDDEFVVENMVNEAMLGGIVVKLGTKSIDLSIEDMIKEMEQELDE